MADVPKLQDRDLLVSRLGHKLKECEVKKLTVVAFSPGHDDPLHFCLP